MKAAIYTRMSQDATGEALGVARQERDCRALAEARGWEIVDVFSDNDLSATTGRRRPEFERLLAAMEEAGAFEVLVAWHPDRLYRHPKDLERLVGIAEARGIEMATVQAGHLDLSTASGRMVARMLGAAARYEVEHKSARQRAKALEQAQAGLPATGGTRPFGFNDDRRTIRPEEAAVIRAGVDAILAGASLRSTIPAMPTPTGGRWQATPWKRCLLSPRLAGVRRHHGRVYDGAWEGIITLAEHERLRAILTDPARNRARAPRRYLLAGLVFCSTCGGRMVARPTDAGKRRYWCAKESGGCNARAAIAETLEAWVVEQAAPRLTVTAVEEREGADVEALVALERITVDREALADAYAAGRVGTEAFATASAALDRAAEEARGALRDQARPSARITLPAPDVVTAEGVVPWLAALGFEEQRAFIEQTVERIEVGPGRRGYNRFDPSRFTLVWRA